MSEPNVLILSPTLSPDEWDNLRAYVEWHRQQARAAALDEARAAVLNGIPHHGNAVRPEREQEVMRQALAAIDALRERA